MSDERVLAIDNGTQSVRALAFNLRGELVAKSQVALDGYQSPQPRWMELDPEEFWRALCKACRQLWSEGAVSPRQRRCAAKH